ncbi:MAG: hypothetical protein IKU19_02535 [Clostridia bacterium]|nr:hypothetical protein [Clostridia bacterium]
MLNHQLMDVVVEPSRVSNPDVAFVIVAAVVAVVVAVAVAVIIRSVNKKKKDTKDE